MSRKVITDWDEHFEHWQEVRYRYWKRLYTLKVDEARDKEVARQLYSTLFHGINLVTTPQSLVGRAIIPELIDTAYEAKVDYYAGLYESFKTTWQLHQRKPVSIFLKNTAPESVRMYRLRLANPFDWDEQLKVQTEAAEYSKSYSGKKEIVDWLCFCATRERFTKYLETGQDLAHQEDSQSMYHPVIPSIEQGDNLVILPAPSTPDVKKRKGPKTETKRKDYELILAKMKGYIDDGMSKKAAIYKVSKEIGRSDRVIYVAIEGSGL